MKLVAMSLAVSLTACSFVTTSAPKEAPDPPSCSDSYSSPVLDVLGVFVGAPMMGLLAWGLTAKGASDSEEDTAIGLTMGTTMIAFTVSAIVGFSRVSRCNDAQDAYRGEMMMRNAQPQYYAPPPVYAPPIAEPPAGTERGFCRPNGTCDPGLTCASNRCVVLPVLPALPATH